MTNMVIWIAAGSAIGWLGFAVFHANAQRGLAVSVISNLLASRGMLDPA